SVFRCGLIWGFRWVSGFVPADVRAIDKHAWYYPHQRPRIARRWDTLKFDSGEVRGRADLLNVDGWTGFRHTDRFRDPGDLHRHRKVDVLADLDNHVLANQHRETRERKRQVVRPRRQIVEAEFTGLHADGRSCCIPTLKSCHDFRQHTTLLIPDSARNASCRYLRKQTCTQQEKNQK